MRGVLCVLALVSVWSSTAEAKKTIAAMPFEAKAPEGKSDAKAIDEATIAVLNDTMLQALHEMGDYNVLGKTDLERLIGFQGMRQLLGCSALTCSASVGNQVGADFLVTPSVGLVGQTVVLTMRMLDIKKVAITASEQQRADAATINWVQVVRRTTYALLGKRPPEDLAADAAQAAASQSVKEQYEQDRKMWIIKMSTMFGLAVVTGVTFAVLFALRPTADTIRTGVYHDYLGGSVPYSNVSGTVLKGNIMLGAAYGSAALAVIFAAIGIGYAANAPTPPGTGVTFNVSPQGASLGVYGTFDSVF